MFKEELDYFILNQNDLVDKYRGKFLVIKKKNILGVYPSALNAYLVTKQEHELGSFMIQPCEPGPGAYTVTLVPNSLTTYES